MQAILVRILFNIKIAEYPFERRVKTFPVIPRLASPQIDGMFN